MVEWWSGNFGGTCHGGMVERIVLLTFGWNMSWWNGRVDLAPHILVKHVWVKWKSGSYSSHLGGTCHGEMVEWIVLLAFGWKMSWWNGRADLTPKILIERAKVEW